MLILIQKSQSSRHWAYRPLSLQPRPSSLEMKNPVVKIAMDREATIVAQYRSMKHSTAVISFNRQP
jgi:hypothetical protein